jgi:hypothetical protein
MKTLKLIFSTLLFTILTFSCSSDSSSSDDEELCDDAIAATVAAQQAYNNATSANHSELCNAYKTALENQIVACGDSSGDLQNIITDLGDCTLPPTTGTLSMNLGSAPLVFDEITVTTTGTTRHVHGEKSNTTSYEIDFDVVVGQTGANKINNFELRLFSQTYTPLIPAAFGNDWASNITVNSGTSIVGTFHGELVNASETSVQDLLSGVVDIDF